MNLCEVFSCASGVSVLYRVRFDCVSDLVLCAGGCRCCFGFNVAWRGVHQCVFFVFACVVCLVFDFSLCCRFVLNRRSVLVLSM